LAEERIKAAGYAGRIRVWLMDYRKWVAHAKARVNADVLSMPESWKRQFDRVVSIEMLEAVG
jgi:cyclopropane-fatty-acyl-phospholipid synthase